MPLATLNAFRDHGRARTTLGAEWEKADAILANAAALGLDVHAIAERLQTDGLTAFDASYDALLAAVEDKRCRIREAVRRPGWAARPSRQRPATCAQRA